MENITPKACPWTTRLCARTDDKCRKNGCELLGDFRSATERDRLEEESRSDADPGL